LNWSKRKTTRTLVKPKKTKSKDNRQESIRQLYLCDNVQSV
jgi:hypothetical protein